MSWKMNGRRKRMLMLLMVNLRRFAGWMIDEGIRAHIRNT